MLGDIYRAEIGGNQVVWVRSASGRKVTTTFPFPVIIELHWWKKFQKIYVSTQRGIEQCYWRQGICGGQIDFPWVTQK